MKSAILLFVALGVVPVHAAWIEVESENFVFVGETSEKAGKRIIRDLEIYRRTVLAIVGVGDSPEQRKVRIFGLRGTSGIRKITGRKQIAGIYTNSNDYPVFVTDVKGNSQDTRATAYHEFAHHIINSYANSYYPRWYNEGFAEYLASFEARKDRVIVGKPATDFAYALNEPRWLDIDVMTSAVTEYPFKMNGSQRESQRARLFYGMSWLAVHYIQNTPELKSGFSAYVTNLNGGEDPTKAFEESFNISLDEFYRQLRKYWKQDRFTMFHFEAKSLLADPEFTSRKLEDTEVERRLAEIRVLFLSSSDNHRRAREKAREKLLSLIAEYGNSIEYSTALVSIAIKEDDHDGALAIAESAYAQNPNNTAAIQTLADALFHRHATGETPAEEDYLRSRELFAQVIERDPMNPTANNHYPATFVFSSEEPDQMALRAVNVDLQFNRNPSNFSTYLQAAEIYRLGGRPDYSCALLQPVALWIRRDAANRPDDETAEKRAFKDRRLQQLDKLFNQVGSSCE